MRQVKTKLHPFRILVLLMYGEYPWATWTGDEVSLVPAQLTRTLRVSRRRLGEYFEWLEKYGYVSDLHEDGRRIVFRLNRPARWMGIPTFFVPSYDPKRFKSVEP